MVLHTSASSINSAPVAAVLDFISVSTKNSRIIKILIIVMVTLNANISNTPNNYFLQAMCAV